MPPPLDVPFLAAVPGSRYRGGRRPLCGGKAASGGLRSYTGASVFEKPCGTRDLALRGWGRRWGAALAQTDLSGVYSQNRQIGGNEVRSNFNPFTHTFVFTTNPDGSLAHTYSWRNIGSTSGGWFQDELPDRSAAMQALSGGYYLDKLCGSDIVPYVQSSFDYLSNYNHMNQWVNYNCKQEVNNLVTVAIWMQGLGGH